MNRMDHLYESDAATPGGVYLCQVNEAVSCGACCGLYNLADASRSHVTDMLIWRTTAFASVPRRIDDILAFGKRAEDREKGVRPFPEFHHCPYIGLVGKDRSRAGCLLHPLADGNNGVDLRGLSYYGGMACRSYFCPTCRNLAPVQKQVVRGIVEDWYEYGLLITEWKLLAAFFEEIERRTGRPMTLEMAGRGPVREALGAVLRLKIDWPYRVDSARLAGYFFEDGAYSKAPLDLETIGVQKSPYALIFQELESAFDSREEFRQAEALLDRLFEPFDRNELVYPPYSSSSRTISSSPR